MHANPTSKSDDLVDDLIERAIMEAVDGADRNIAGEQLQERAQSRYDELTSPYREGLAEHFGETIHEALLEVAMRELVTGGRDPVSVDKVIDAAMAKFARTLGEPEDPAAARAAIRSYIDQFHRLPRAGSAGPDPKS